MTEGTMRTHKSHVQRAPTLLGTLFLAFWCSIVFAVGSIVFADGKVVPPRNYKGSLEERSQEAIIIFHAGTAERSAKQDMILKIEVEGDATEFAWIVPFPSAPKVTKEDPKLFKEIFDYVQSRKRRSGKSDGAKSAPQAANDSEAVDSKVKVISRQIVGDFDVVVVQEKADGGLNPWLEEEGFQTLDKADDVIGYYREQGYVFACIKVNSEPLAKQKSIESHPLRFTFETKGRDGIFFPMRMTSLQEKPFDVNLYVFYGAWLNDKLSKYGYKHRGFQLYHRDWDTSRCKPNAGKSWSSPEDDPYLENVAHRIPLLTKLFQKLHPGEKYYLTNIRALNVDPEDVREWTSDLWMFPYYTNRDFVPYDVREDGPAAKAYPNVADSAPQKPAPSGATAAASANADISEMYLSKWVAVGPIMLIVGVLAVSIIRRMKI
jgi:hypothetical protein